ncbi:hypothetical protein KEM48_003017 [Puccinia striiformis f. sp. tritici PST-130]|nr:hypothetical protein KEM48_003017 [Puccinia striiformis f. sp. tritici PST-130]
MQDPSPQKPESIELQPPSGIINSDSDSLEAEFANNEQHITFSDSDSESSELGWVNREPHMVFSDSESFQSNSLDIGTAQLNSHHELSQSPPDSHEVKRRKLNSPSQITTPQADSEPFLDAPLTISEDMAVESPTVDEVMSQVEGEGVEETTAEETNYLRQIDLITIDMFNQCTISHNIEGVKSQLTINLNQKPGEHYNDLDIIGSRAKVKSVSITKGFLCTNHEEV